MPEATPLCVILACAAGMCMTLSAVAMAYPAQCAHQNKTDMATRTKIAAFISNLLLTGCGIVLNVIAVGYGPVALATPLSVGANLLSNMVLQSFLGIAKYTKSMIVGTLVLAAAVTILTGVGPGDVEPDTVIENLLLAPPALAFLASICFLIVSCLSLILTGACAENAELTLLYAVLGGCSTVINTAITKAVQMTMPHAVKICLLLLYLVLSIVGLSAAALANGSLDDPSVFVPLSAGVQLVLTCIAGLCIWQDGLRLHLPLCYAMVYVLIVIGSYLVSSFDTLGQTRAIIANEEVGIVREMTRRKLGKTMSNTLLDGVRASLPDPGALVEDDFRRRARNLIGLMDNPRETDCLKPMIKRCLRTGCKVKRLSEHDLIELCLSLVEHYDSTFQCDALKSWLAEYTRMDSSISHDSYRFSQPSFLQRQGSSMSDVYLLDNCPNPSSVSMAPP